MTLQKEGAISLKNIADEYGETVPYVLGEYAEYVDKTRGTPISIGDIYGRSAKSIILENKSFDVYTKRDALIPVANILAGSIDEYSDGQEAIKLVAVQKPVNGTVIIDGANVVFSSTGGVGIAANFEVVVENSIGVRVTGLVTLNVVALPNIVCNPDSFNLQQGETLLINTQDLLENDEDLSNTGLSFLSVGNAIGGTVNYEPSSDSVSFMSTGLAGEPAEFNYLVRSGAGVEQTGIAYVNITSLPELEAYVYRTEAETSEAVSNYSPPTMLDVFNSWGRFDGNNYYTNRQDAIDHNSTNASAWTFDQTSNSVVMPLNVSPSNGFVSEETVENYTFEATLTSNDGDNDTIGLVAAFVREGSTNYILTIVLNTGGTAPSSTGCGVYFGYSGVGSGDVLLGEFNIGVGSGWNNRKVRVKIQRQEDIFTFYVTNWDSLESYVSASKIVVDIKDYDYLSRFQGPKSYGYITNSQPNSTYIDVSFKGGLDATKIYDAERNLVWEYSNDAWAIIAGTIQSHLGFIRKVFNPETGGRYLISADNIVDLGTLVDNTEWSSEKLRNESQYVIPSENLPKNGAIEGTELIALYTPDNEQKNYLKDLTSVTTTSAHTYSASASGFNNLGGLNWFSEQGIDLATTDFINGTIVFDDGAVGRIVDIGNSNGSSAYIQYDVMSYRLFDLS